MSYNPWPLGQVPAYLRRPEPELIKKLGYKWDDAREIVEIFESEVAIMFGSRYAVSVDCCSHAIFLSLEYSWWNGEFEDNFTITIPEHTYISVPMQIDNSMLDVEFKDLKWQGMYALEGSRVIDAALIWSENAYVEDSLMCLSFQIKKRIPIGKGGMILTNDKEAYEWLKLASYDGRDLNTPYDSEDHVRMCGYHYYMTPEDAARGLILMNEIPRVNPPQGGWENYPNISKIWEKL